MTALDDQSTQPGVADPPNASPPESAAPGLREQLRATRDAAARLISAHLELARAELDEILDAAKRVALLAGLALAALLFAGLLVAIGSVLFMGEWLFGSIGWGVLLGSELLVAVAIALVLAALGAGGGRLARDFAIALVIGVVVGLALGLDLTSRGWSQVADQLNPSIATEWRVTAVASGLSAAVLGGVFALAALAKGGGFGGFLGGLVGGAILGALIGWLTAVAPGPRVGAAIGVAVALAAWPALAGAGVYRRGIDREELKSRFWPAATIDTTKETIAWVREQTPRGRRS